MKYLAGLGIAMAIAIGGYVLWFSGHGNLQDANPKDLVGKSIGSFPYHPLIYHLDLSILAYQLYGQSLVWPFDPYYEGSDERGDLKAKVRSWARTKGAEQVRDNAGLDGYRGPGVLGGFPDNAAHDPILYSYGRICPWSPCITNVENVWTEYLTPAEITARISSVYVCYRRTGGEADDVVLERVRTRPDAAAPEAGDILLAFEGGTGDKGETNQPASQSLMGFVLLRKTAADRYDVHVAFRGSRSGSAGRAVVEAISTSDASGNPDWITDLGNRHVARTFISGAGSVHRGFARSLESISPALFRCLTEVAQIQHGLPPEHIYVTGHSLGGGLAQHFVSAVLLGNRYGSDGRGETMPPALGAWPWKQVKLITYSAPRAGDSEWAERLTRAGLDSEFYASGIQPYDGEALVMTNPGILTRLLDAARPAGYRVLISKDPITSQLGRGEHVGKTVYLNVPSPLDVLPPPDFTAHEPWKMRELMVEGMEESRAPRIAWRYRPMKELNPEWNEAEWGSSAELNKLTGAVKRYYSAGGFWFDHDAFDWCVTLRLAMEGD